MPKKKEKPTEKSSQVLKNNKKQDAPGHDQASDAEEDPFDNPNLPSQEHCTWLLNVIKIHAKKIAEEWVVYEGHLWSFFWAFFLRFKNH